MNFMEAKSRCQQGCITSGASRGEILPFLTSRSLLLSLTHGFFLHLQSTSLQPMILLSSFLFLTLILLSPSYNDSCDLIRPTDIIQENLPISKSLIPYATFFLLHKVEFSQVLEIRM